MQTAQIHSAGTEWQWHPTCWWSQNHRTGWTGWKRPQKITWFMPWWEREPRQDYVAPQTPPWGSLTDYPHDFFFLLCNIPFLYQDDGIGLPTRKLFPLPRIYYWQSRQCEGLSHFSSPFSYCPFQGCGGRSTQVQMSQAILRMSSLVTGSSNCQWQWDAVFSLVSKHSTWNIL